MSEHLHPLDFGNLTNFGLHKKNLKFNMNIFYHRRYKKKITMTPMKYFHVRLLQKYGVQSIKSDTPLRIKV